MLRNKQICEKCWKTLKASDAIQHSLGIHASAVAVPVSLLAAAACCILVVSWNYRITVHIHYINGNAISMWHGQPGSWFEIYGRHTISWKSIITSKIECGFSNNHIHILRSTFTALAVGVLYSLHRLTLKLLKMKWKLKLYVVDIFLPPLYLIISHTVHKYRGTG